MADTKTPGVDKRQIPELMKINPLIDFDRDTSHVESVLSLISFLVLDAAAGSLTLNYDQAHGLAFMLNACEAALKTMRDGEVRHG
jgi:hypothetical protein